MDYQSMDLLSRNLFIALHLVLRSSLALRHCEFRYKRDDEVAFQQLIQ